MPTRLISRYRADAAERNPKPDKDRDVLPENLVEISEECRNFPVYSELGFLDSVDVSTGAASGCILAVDQGMIMAAAANALADDAMQHAFSDGFIEQAVRPLVAQDDW